ncbi:hypothetical protein FPRO05_10763 [Fusarium proliferatum]|uniref:Uncharacterized protein n=1 Tax=Gibberella intermedia TaxID=948311 RepID=A0A365ND40_GIBIN|nr:hypothetical protein FPRO05_10763 [Fusarium proliferatum]
MILALLTLAIVLLVVSLTQLHHPSTTDVFTAGAAPAPRVDFISSTSSGGGMGMSAPRAQSQTDSAPANINGDTTVNGNSPSFAYDSGKRVYA